MVTDIIRRGDIFLVNFSPVRENEANYTRPSVIVTNNMANEYNTVVTVVPLTTNLERVYDFQLFLPNTRTGLEKDSKAQVEQIRSVALSRMIRHLGQVPEDLMFDLDSRIRLHLSV